MGRSDAPHAFTGLKLCIVKEKLLQLFDERWTTELWENFMECLKDNTR